jgi:hypothetical protein
MPRHVLAAFLAAALLGAGCGEGDTEPTSGGAPAITTGDEPYENGAADGSGADGEEEKADRGGIAAGPDNKEPGDRPFGDPEQQPPRSAEDDR